MKKFHFFLFVISSLFIFFAACTKKNAGNDKPTYPTLEQRYPAWTDLTWVSTDKDSNTYPRLSITIRENVVTIRQDTCLNGSISQAYSAIYLLGNMITFEGKGQPARLTAYYRQTDSTLIIRTLGMLVNNPYNVHTYLLFKHAKISE